MYSQVLPLLLLAAFSNALILQSTIDVYRLQGILQDSLKNKDITSIYYAIRGLKQLNVKIPQVCQEIVNAKYDLNNVEQVFYLTNAAALSGCLNSLKPDVLSAASQGLNKKDATIPELYHAVYSLKALGKGTIYDKEEGLKNLIQLLKKDDTPANYGYVFGLCEHMGCQGWTETHAEGALLAADESDSRALHFEGGLPVTSLVLTTIIRTYKSLKKPTPLTEEQRYKFAEYLLSRKSVNTAKGAALLLDAAITLADDEPSPVSIFIKGRKYITSEADTIEISITDLIGRPARGLRPEEVVAQSGTRLSDDVVVLSKQPLTPKPNEPEIFILNLSKVKAQYGLYKIALSAGARSTSVNVAVLGDIQVSSIEIGIGDVDGTTSPKITTVAYPNKLREKLSADHLQKVSLKWSVRDKAGKPVAVQQAFVRIARGDSAEDEAIFVAEPDSSKTYKVELNVGSIAKHLQGVSGPYSLTLYLGDNAVSSPIAWQLGEINFVWDKETALGAVAPSKRSRRGPLPGIAHSFRSAEARPARLVSDAFALAAAAPLLLLLVLWASLGLNFSNFPFTPAALVFHLGLGGCLALYALFWVQLTMFETVRYLLPLAALTFLSGHRLLRRLAQDKSSR